jgi:hypothetical protein
MDIQAGAIEHQLQTVKDVYAEFFLLLDQSLREDPLAEEAGRLNGIIEPLMATIERATAELRAAVADHRARSPLSPTLEQSIGEFDRQLHAMLQLMLDRVRQRTQRVSQERDRVKGELQLIRRKRSGAKGYRPRIEGSLLVKSKI